MRVSTTDQANGVEAQRSAVEVWARARGVELLAVLEDEGVSGATPIEQRPGLVAAVEALRTHRAGVLVVAKRDRIARDVIISAVVEHIVSRHGASLVSADGAGNGDGPEDQLLRQILAAVAQYERQLIRARTRLALAAKRARGEAMGGVPIGSRVDEGMLVPCEEEQRAIQRIIELRDAGLTCGAITRTLNREGYRARGARWYRSGVSRLLARESQGAGPRSAPP